MIINTEKKLSKRNLNLPDFILAGYPRCGTTSLYQYLYFHPQILLSTPKEPRFFIFYNMTEEVMKSESDVTRKTSVLDIEQYSRIFKKGKNKVCGDMTVSHMKHFDTFVHNIKAVYPQGKMPKLIFALRNPIEASFSSFNYQYTSGKLDSPDFMAWLKKAKADKDSGIRGIGQFASVFDVYDYPGHITELRKTFDDIYIYLLDDMKRDPMRIMHEIYEFLGVKKIMPDDLGKVYNRAGKVKKDKRAWVVSAKSSILKNVFAKIVPEAIGRRWMQKTREKQYEKAEMDKAQKAFLRENFKDTITQTGKILGRDLSGWLDA